MPRSSPAGARPITQALCRMGRIRPAGEEETRFEKLAEGLWKMALNDDHLAIRLIMDYCEGRPAPAAVREKAAGARLVITADDLERATRELAAWEREVDDGRPGSESGGAGSQPEAPRDAGEARAGGPAGLHSGPAG